MAVSAGLDLWNTSTANHVGYWSINESFAARTRISYHEDVLRGLCLLLLAGCTMTIEVAGETVGEAGGEMGAEAVAVEEEGGAEEEEAAPPPCTALTEFTFTLTIGVVGVMELPNDNVLW